MPSTRYELQPCTPDDRGWAYALKAEAYREVVERQFGSWDEPFQQDLFAQQWNPAISHRILIDGRSVGLLALRETADEIRVDEIQFSLEWRGKGLGTLILTDLICQAHKCGKSLRLQVLKENARARQLYCRLGLALAGETDTHYLMSITPSHHRLSSQSI